MWLFYGLLNLIDTGVRNIVDEGQTFEMTK